MKTFTIMLFLLIGSCPVQLKDEGAKLDQSISDRVLIVYLSRTNNTKAIAEIIQTEVGGDMVALELVNPYPENYRAIVKQVAEENETGFLPPLKTKINPTEYDTVYIGFTTWGMQLPPPMKSFLAKNDLGGKTVIPFNTNGGYGIGSSFRKVKELCPESTVLEGFTIKGGSERDGIYLAIQGERREEARRQVQAWLQQLKIKSYK